MIKESAVVFFVLFILNTYALTTFSYSKPKPYLRPYQYSFRTADQKINQESLYVHGEDSPWITGSYSFFTDGRWYKVVYVADKDGYRPRVIFNAPPPPLPPPEWTTLAPPFVGGIGPDAEGPQPPIPARPPPEAVDPTLLCTLLGSGC